MEIECWECEGSGYSYGTCPTCGGSGKLCDDCKMGVEFCDCEADEVETKGGTP